MKQRVINADTQLSVGSVKRITTMKQRIINALYVLKECARRAVTPALMYLFFGMLALAASAISDENAWLRLFLAILCVLGAAALNVDQGVRVGKKHYQMYLSGEVRRSGGIETINNKDRKTYKFEMEYRWYKGFLTGVIICVPLIICCIIYASGNYFNNENLSSASNLVMIMFCGWAIIPLVLIFGDINVLWSLCFCAIPIIVTTVSYLVGMAIEKKAYLEREARLESIRNGERPVSNREKKRQERENRRFR